MRLHAATAAKLRAVHAWAIEHGKPFTSEEMAEEKQYMSKKTARNDLKILTSMRLLSCEKKVVKGRVACVYSVGSRKEFPPPIVDEKARKGKLGEYGVANERRIIKQAEQIGVERPWYLTCLFGDWRAA